MSPAATTTKRTTTLEVSTYAVSEQRDTSSDRLTSCELKISGSGRHYCSLKIKFGLRVEAETAKTILEALSALTNEPNKLLADTVRQLVWDTPGVTLETTFHKQVTTLPKEDFLRLVNDLGYFQNPVGLRDTGTGLRKLAALVHGPSLKRLADQEHKHGICYAFIDWGQIGSANKAGLKAVVDTLFKMQGSLLRQACIACKVKDDSAEMFRIGGDEFVIASKVGTEKTAEIVSKFKELAAKERDAMLARVNQEDKAKVMRAAFLAHIAKQGKALTAELITDVKQLSEAALGEDQELKEIACRVYDEACGGDLIRGWKETKAAIDSGRYNFLGIDIQCVTVPPDAISPAAYFQARALANNGIHEQKEASTGEQGDVITLNAANIPEHTEPQKAIISGVSAMVSGYDDTLQAINSGTGELPKQIRALLHQSSADTNIPGAISIGPLAQTPYLDVVHSMSGTTSGLYIKLNGSGAINNTDPGHYEAVDAAIREATKKIKLHVTDGFLVFIDGGDSIVVIGDRKLTDSEVSTIQEALKPIATTLATQIAATVRTSTSAATTGTPPDTQKPGTFSIARMTYTPLSSTPPTSFAQAVTAIKESAHPAP